MISIDTAADPRVDTFRTLKGRESTDVLWAEGSTVVERLLASRIAVVALLTTSREFDRLRVPVDDGVKVYVAEQSVVNSIVGFDLHRGIVAVANRPSLLPLDDLIGSAKTLVVLEGVNDSVNLGAIGRSTRALGGDGLLLDPTSADPYYRRSVRVSMGELLHLPVGRAPLESAFERLVSAGFEIWALTPNRSATTLAEARADGVPERLAMVFGAEGPGLSDDVLSRHRNVRIPINRDVDSLNVGHAVAAALASLSRCDPASDPQM